MISSNTVKFELESESLVVDILGDGTNVLRLLNSGDEIP